MVDKINVVKGVQANRLKNFKYLVRIPDLFPGLNIGFSNVTGLNFGEIEEIEYREGTDASTPVKYPGQTTYPNVTLERGIAFDVAQEYMESWHSAVSEAAVFGGLEGGADGLERLQYLKDVEIYVNDKTGIIGRALQLQDAWVRSIALGDLSGDGNEIWIASFEIVHHGIVRLPDDWFSAVDVGLSLPGFS